MDAAKAWRKNSQAKTDKAGRGRRGDRSKRKREAVQQDAESDEEREEELEGAARPSNLPPQIKRRRTEKKVKSLPVSEKCERYGQGFFDKNAANEDTTGNGSCLVA